MFHDRTEAGKRLAEKLSFLEGKDCIVLAIPRGGIIIGYEIAKRLGVKLDVIVSKKINPPGRPELAIGAVMPDGTMLWNIDPKRLPEDYIKKESDTKRFQAQEYLKKFRLDQNYDNIKGKTVIIADDGIATGASVLVIMSWLQSFDVKDIIVATPVVSSDIYNIIKQKCNIISLLVPTYLDAVSRYYEKFPQVSDKQALDVINSYQR